VWGQVFLWLVGSCNYLWTATLILLFLLPFRLKQENPDYKLSVVFSILFFFLGILAGWSNEGSGAAVLVLLFAYFIYKIITKRKFTSFEILGLIGFLIGFTLLITAPGNFARAGLLKEWWGDYYSGSFVQQFRVVTIMFMKNYGVLLIAVSAFLGFDLIYHQKRKLHVFFFFYFLTTLAAAYSMILSPILPHRAFFIVTVFAVITLGNILTQTDIRVPDIIKRNMTLFVVLGLLFFSFSFLRAGKNTVGTYLRWQSRIEYILEEKRKGNLEIVVKPIVAENKHTALFQSCGVEDVNWNEHHWVNKAVAEYFGVKSVRTDGEPEKIKLSRIFKR
jgi:hypothetical protein